jgi:hypothetical protein
LGKDKCNRETYLETGSRHTGPAIPDKVEEKFPEDKCECEKDLRERDEFSEHVLLKRATDLEAKTDDHSTLYAMTINTMQPQ